MLDGNSMGAGRRGRGGEVIRSTNVPMYLGLANFLDTELRTLDTISRVATKRIGMEYFLPNQ